MKKRLALKRIKQRYTRPILYLRCVRCNYDALNKLHHKYSKEPFPNDLDIPLMIIDWECHEVHPIPPEEFPDELTDEEWNWDVQNNKD